MRIYFACPLVERRKNHWHPLINVYRNETLGSFPCVWKPSRPPAETWCVGQAEVDATQLAALAADPDIQITIDIDDRKLEDALPAHRAALDSFCEKAGMEKAGDKETFRESGFAGSSSSSVGLSGPTLR
jgi:hypothetical protein